MNLGNVSRKNFIKSSSLLLGGLMAQGNAVFADGQQEQHPIQSSGSKSLLLKNVRLETGFHYENEIVSGTKTDLFTLEIVEGKIKNIQPNNPNAKAIDAKGYLMLPAFRDMHIHLDKTFYGGPWKANTKRNRTVKDMIALEQQIIPELLKTSTYRAEKLIELLQSKGSSYARSHVNIDPTSKLDSLKNLELALQRKKNSFQAELVAFPQHGVYYTKSEPWMKEAAKMDIDFIGGLDPYAIDGDTAKGLDFIVKLAMENHKGIDIHLHEGGAEGLNAVEFLIDRVNENPALKGRTFLSHCFVLAKLEKAKLEEVSEKLAHAQIGIVSTIPMGSRLMPIPTLYKYGVNVMTGNDSIIDHWDTFGTGNVLQKCNLMAQLYGYRTEQELSRCLKLATGNVLPLDEQGNRQWPKVNDTANLVLVEASCSAEAVARISPVKSLIHEGNVVF